MNLQIEEGNTSNAIKIFGTNASESLSNTIGTVLSLSNVALDVWDLYTATDRLHIAMDALKVTSASLAVIGLAAGWIAGSVENGIDDGIYIACQTLGMAAAWTGPSSVAFALGT